MEIRNYQRVQCSGHRQAHQTQEKNAGENFNKEIGNIKKNQSELQNTITKMEHTLERANSKLENSEEQITNLTDRGVEIAQSEQEEKISK